MGFTSGATTIPGKGTILVADPDTTVGFDFMTIDPTAANFGAVASPTEGWTAMGHTSRENNVSMSKDGGDVTPVGSWWDPQLRQNRAETNCGLTANSIQVDALTLGMAFGGGTLDTVEGSYDVGDIVPQDKAVFVLVVDSGGNRMGLYVPNTSVSVGDAPEFPLETFFEVQLSFAIKNSETTGKKFRWYHPALKSA